MRKDRFLLFMIKSYIQSPLFLFVMIVFVMMGFIISANSKRPASVTDDKVHVSVMFTGDNDVFKKNIMNTFSENSSIEFIDYTDEDAFKDSVTSRSSECGYIIPSDLNEYLLSGNKDVHIMTYVSPSSVLTPVINEAVYAAVFKELAPEALYDYLVKYSSVQDDMTDVSYEDTYALYKRFLGSGDTFSVKVLLDEEAGHRNRSAGVLNVRGIFALLSLCGAFAGALKFYGLKDNSFFNSFFCRLSYILTPLFINVFISEINSVISGSGLHPVRSMIFILTTAVMVCALTLIIKSRTLFSAFIPVYIVLSLVFTPVFIDVYSFLPSMRFISYLFTPVYYIKSEIPFSSL